MNNIDKIEVEDTLDKLQHLDQYEEFNLNWSEEGGATIIRVWDIYILFEVPVYGGEPNYIDSYHFNNLEELIEEVGLWI